MSGAKTVKIVRELEAVQSSVNRGEYIDDQLYREEQKFTASKLRYMLPKGSKVVVTQATVDMVNDIIEKSQCHRGLMEERLATYTSLIGPGVGIKQLLKAIQFVTLCLTPGMTQIKAYMITFPEKAQELIDRGAEGSNFAGMYAQTKLVTTIMKSVQLAPSIELAPLRHKVADKLLELMDGKGANGSIASPTVQLNAAIALYDIVKIPEEQTINLKTGMDDESKAATQHLADQIERSIELQMARLKKGESISDVQRLDIVIDAEVS